jgi:BirA family biotin operon repressor/biotin-[acetyl-CoA-carboxylase] ligase
MAAIDIDSIRAAAAGVDLTVETVDRTASTNRLLMDAPFGPEPAEPRLLATAEQTAGRGRRGRGWVMEPGRSVAFSIAIERRVEGSRPPLGLPIAVGVALMRTLAPLAPGLQLKWPNDLQRDGRKLGGILVESRRGPDGAHRIERIVIGIGLNLLPPRDPDGLIGQPVSGVFEEGALPLPADHLIGRIAAAVLGDLGCFFREGLQPFMADWQRIDALRDRSVAILAEDRIESSGIARGIELDGALLVETAQGLRAVHSGEVSVRIDAQARAATGAPWGLPP